MLLLLDRECLNFSRQNPFRWQLINGNSICNAIGQSRRKQKKHLPLEWKCGTLLLSTAIGQRPPRTNSQNPNWRGKLDKCTILNAQSLSCTQLISRFWQVSNVFAKVLITFEMYMNILVCAREVAKAFQLQTWIFRYEEKAKTYALIWLTV